MHLIDVDVRWGVTEEEAEQGKALEIILDEVEHSRPFFVGILGKRYGSIPDNIPEDAVFVYPWLENYPEDASEPDPLVIERQMHEAFAEERSHLHIGLVEETELLTEHVTETIRQPVVITGESGSDKFSFLSEFSSCRSS